MVSLVNILLASLLLLGSNETLDISSVLQKKLSNYKRFEYKLVSHRKIDFTKIKFDSDRETRLASGYAYLPIKVRAFSNNYKNSTLTVKVKLYEDVAVANYKLKRSEKITTNDFRIEEREVSSLRSKPIKTFKELRKLRVKRSIKQDAILEDNMFEAIPDVKKGDRISAVYQKGIVKISFDVVARTEGVIGKTIKVKRTDNKIFKAVVLDSKQVKIIE